MRRRPRLARGLLIPPWCCRLRVPRPEWCSPCTLLPAPQPDPFPLAHQTPARDRTPRASTLSGACTRPAGAWRSPPTRGRPWQTSSTQRALQTWGTGGAGVMGAAAARMLFQGALAADAGLLNAERKLQLAVQTTAPAPHPLRPAAANREFHPLAPRDAHARLAAQPLGSAARVSGGMAQFDARPRRAMASQRAAPRH